MSEKLEGLCPTNAATCSALPGAAGFYWWRETNQRKWRMVQIVNFAADSDIPYLAAYDVEHRTFGGRTLRQWARHEPIGQWVPVHKPNDRTLATQPAPQMPE